MTPPSNPPITTTGKVILSVLAALSALRLYDYIYFGQDYRNLMAAIALGLVAYGAYQNRFGKRRTPAGTYATGIGIVLMLTSIALRFV